MPNEEQLAILKQGVDVWNKWLNSHLDLLGNIDLHGADLRGAVLPGAFLAGTNLRDADLTEADLSQADLGEADLTGAKLVAANFAQSNLRNAKFIESDLRGSDLRGADLRGADLRKAILRAADLRGTQLEGSKLWSADFAGADLRGVKLEGAHVLGAKLSNAIIYDEPEQTLANVYANVLVYSRPRYSKPLDKGKWKHLYNADWKHLQAHASHAVPRLPTPEVSFELHQHPVDEVFFTAIHPKEGKVETWHTLLVYAHLLSAIEDVRRDTQRFKDEIPVPKEFSSASAARIARGTELTVVPSCDGVVFNPKRFMFKWMERYHRAGFRFKADKSLAYDAARGEINIYVGPLIIQSLKFAMLFNETGSAPDRIDFGKIYRQEDIFVSYSHKDSEFVLALKKAYNVLGFNVLRDVDNLRSGQVWNEELMRMIDRATIFQLFWSENSRQSQYCRQEWEHALKRNKEGFIRPVYWETPIPKPPEELSRFHFAYYSPDANRISG